MSKDSLNKTIQSGWVYDIINLKNQSLIRGVTLYISLAMMHRPQEKLVASYHDYVAKQWRGQLQLLGVKGGDVVCVWSRQRQFAYS